MPKVYRDDTGPVLPIVAHAGDLLSRWARGHHDYVTQTLGAFRQAGFDGVRTWTVLHGDYWAGREIGPMHQADYWAHVEGFVGALRQTGMRWLVSQGDLLRAVPDTPSRERFALALGSRMRVEDVVGVDAGNEALWNGETDPEKMRRVVDAFRAVCPCDMWSLTSPGTELAADLDRYGGSVYDEHGYRDGHLWDKLRHIFSIAYESRPDARIGVQSEPFGMGRNVTVTANEQELDDESMALACIQALSSRQLWTWFTSPGVIGDGTRNGHFDGGEDFARMPGFASTPVARDLLPKDVMEWPTLCHGGASQAQRIYAVPGNDETRADHTISDDGRFVARLYGPRWRECYGVKPHRIETVREFGPWGKVVIGRTE